MKNCCCENINVLCENVDSCTGTEVINFLKTLPAGSYTLVMNFLGTIKRYNFTIDSKEYHSFSTILLNSNYSYIAHVENSSGEKVNFTIDNKIFDCFSFKTY